MFTDFARALSQLSDRRFRRVLWLGLGLTVGLLAAITFVFTWAVGWFLPETVTLPWVGEISWVSNALSFAAVALMLVLSTFLMIPAASAFTGIFLDDVADAVEDRYYPALPAAPKIGLLDTIRDSIGFFGVIVAVNLLALVLFFFVGPLAPILFWAVNGYLLGREYFQMAAMRRLGRAGADKLRRRHVGQIWIAGTLMAIPLTVPILNLIMPILGAATFTHMFHRLSGS